MGQFSMEISGCAGSALSGNQQPADPQPSEVSGWLETGGKVQGRDAEAARIEPLVPAVTHYALSVEEVAHNKARALLPQHLGGVRRVAAGVYADPHPFVRLITTAVQQKGFDAAGVAQAIADRPEQFGTLKGRVRFFGDDKERKYARQVAYGLGKQVEHLSDAWQRRLQSARESEQWTREKQDVIEIPGLSPRSEAILRQIDDLEIAERGTFLEKLVETPEGRQALDEARQSVAAVEKRFGRSDLRDVEPARLMAGHGVVADIARLRDVARMCQHAELAELTRQYDLTRKQSKTLGLGLGLGM